VDCHCDIWSGILCQKIQLANQGAILPGSVERVGVQMWLKNFFRWCPLGCNFVTDDANIFKDLINETGLCHGYCHGTVEFDSISDVDTEKVFDITFVLIKNSVERHLHSKSAIVLSSFAKTRQSSV
jgi:hypothetical protein